MATSIGSSAAFTFGNMKPATGEQLDALWGQNIADNSGFLRAQRVPFLAAFGTEGTLSSTSGNTFADLSYRTIVMRVAGHNRLVGTLRGDGTFAVGGNPDCRGTHGPTFYGDLGTYYGTSIFATTNITGNFTLGSTYSFELNLDSYLSVGSWGTFVGYFSGTSDNSISAHSIQWNFSRPPKLYTTWAN